MTTAWRTGLTLVALLGSLTLRAADAAPAVPVRDWTVLVYMSYDNDLTTNAPLVLAQIEEASAAANVAVRVLCDSAETDRLRELTFAGADRRSRDLDTGNSASEDVVRSFLARARDEIPARRYALVFLNHGGRLDEMCLDDAPGAGIAKMWLSAVGTSAALRDFQLACRGDVALLFLQQCGRASVENLYAFRGCAATLMASPMGVGSPNTYYGAALRWMAQNPRGEIVELTRVIAGNDRHFNSYTVVDGAALAELPVRLRPVLQALATGGVSEEAARVPACFTAGGEYNHDLAAWLQAASCGNAGAAEACTRFLTWTERALVKARYANPQAGREVAALCGLSLHVPRSRACLAAYARHPAYTDTDLPAVWQACLPAGP